MSCIVCSFRLASFTLRSCAGVTNLLLTKNLVADLQDSLFIYSYPSQNVFPKVQCYFL